MLSVQCYIRYIMRSLLVPVVLITCVLTVVIWLTQSLRFIDLIVNRGLDFFTFLYLSSLLIPSLLLVILPIALFSGVLFVYNRLIMDSELLVLNNAGLSRFAIAKPALYVAALVMIVSYLISLYLLPLSYREFKGLQSFIRNNYASILLQEGVFNTPSNGLTVYIEEHLSGGQLKGILVHDERVPGKAVTMMAQEGQLIKTPLGPRFNLLNGSRQEVQEGDMQLSLLYFDHYSLDLSTYTTPSAPRQREPQERYLHELFYPENIQDPATIARLYAEGHQRLTWPVYNMVLTAVALLALLSGQFNRRGQWKRMVFAAVLAIAVVVESIGLNNLLVRNSQMVYLVYGNVVLLLVLGAYLLISDNLRLKRVGPLCAPR